jgi:hypothetical protein
MFRCLPKDRGLGELRMLLRLSGGVPSMVLSVGWSHAKASKRHVTLGGARVFELINLVLPLKWPIAADPVFVE